MAIKVQCGCGKAFAAKDELAGKTVKCPGCQKPLKIPAGNAPAAVAKASAKPAPAKAAAPAAAPEPSDSLFDEIGLAPPTEGVRPCPGCTEPLPLQAVVCVKCGFNTRIGRRMTTEREQSAEGGHGVVAHDLLQRAADVIDGDELEEKKKTGEGMPWWVYLIILIILISGAAFMLLRSGGEEETEEGKAAAVVRMELPYV